jgi:polyhydroxyalkanoate synthesis regulator phasin
MAIKDFKQYLVQVQLQYLEMKQDLTDFEEALKNGFITEEKLEEVKDTVTQLELNYQRLLYVDYLLELPRRDSKKAKAKKSPQNKRLEKYFEESLASSTKVIDENTSLLTQLRKQLKKLENNKNK